MGEARYIYARRIEKGVVKLTNVRRIEKRWLNLRVIGGWGGARYD